MKYNCILVKVVWQPMQKKNKNTLLCCYCCCRVFIFNYLVPVYSLCVIKMYYWYGDYTIDIPMNNEFSGEFIDYLSALASSLPLCAPSSHLSLLLSLLLLFRVAIFFSRTNSFISSITPISFRFNFFNSTKHTYTSSAFWLIVLVCRTRLSSTLFVTRFFLPLSVYISFILEPLCPSHLLITTKIVQWLYEQN